MTPPPLLLVFKIDWENSYGAHRRVTCPDYGLTAKVIKSEVERRSWSLWKALHDLLQRGDRLFADFSCDDRDTLYDTVQAQIDRIKEGNGSDIIRSLMDWVHRVQFRGLQDFAARYQHRFQEAWTTTAIDDWRKHHHIWSEVMRVREDRDLMCTGTSQTPAWSTRVVNLVTDVTNLYRGLPAAIRADDDNWWTTVIRNDIGSVDNILGDVVLHPLALTSAGGEGSPPVSRSVLEADAATLTFVTRSPTAEESCTGESVTTCAPLYQEVR